jgi:hypothetical protein
MNAPTSPVDPTVELAQRHGLQPKEADASVLLIRQESETTFRVMCMAAGIPHQFDVFGQMKPYTEAEGECSVVQKCLEHLGNCILKTKPARTRVLENVNSPFWKLTVTWQAS